MITHQTPMKHLKNMKEMYDSFCIKYRIHTYDGFKEQIVCQRCVFELTFEIYIIARNITF